MVTTLFKLHQGFALVTSLPAFFLCLRKNIRRLLIARTRSTTMPSAVTVKTHLGFAPTTFRYFAAIFATDVGWFDPFSAFSGRAVNPVLGRVLGKFAIPRLFKAVIEKAIDVLERNVIVGAASRRHVLRVRDRKLEDAFEA